MVAAKDGVVTMPTRTADFKLIDQNLSNDLNPGYISEFKD
jgi:hypothetical protein